MDKWSIRYFPIEYVERGEMGPHNLDEKLARLSVGGPFEPWDVVLVNRAVAQLIGTATRILEVGAGTGLFASLAAREATRSIFASEFDEGARSWASTHRAAPNVIYGVLDLKDVRHGEFDLVVAIEVVEHLGDYPRFLAQLAKAAPAAIITTPNKNGSAIGSVAHTPAYEGHVREWTAGEFYWVLRVFYDNVRLYTLPNMPRQLAAIRRSPDYLPVTKECGVQCRDSSIIAYCTEPRHLSS